MAARSSRLWKPSQVATRAWLDTGIKGLLLEQATVCSGRSALRWVEVQKLAAAAQALAVACGCFAWLDVESRRSTNEIFGEKGSPSLPPVLQLGINSQSQVSFGKVDSCEMGTYQPWAVGRGFEHECVLIG